jgi:alkylation response protein AidB-like acyl-CoA dehydrogenase
MARSAHWRVSLPTDTAPVEVTLAAAVPVIGASAADERYDLSRHWRNSRTHASHDPVAWKYHHVGNYLLNDVPPPNHGQI